MTVSDVRVDLIERLAHRTALGVRSYDVHTGETVRDGLSVRVVLDQSDRMFEAVPTASGVFAVRSLPGLRRWETRDVDALGVEQEITVDPIAARIEVRDLLGRFHPCSVQALLPNEPSMSLLVRSTPAGPEFESPPSTYAASIPLFSTPSRSVPAGLGVLRARLVLAASQGPASYAALDVVIDPALPPIRGIADARGEVAVLFPFPAPPRQLGSPPSTKRSLAGTVWTVGLQAHLPRQQPSPLPELERLLDHRPAALTTTTPPTAAVTQAQIQYGRECVLRSSSINAELSVGP